jgi:hypothetical protein
MLAERKKRVRLPTDPNNTKWTGDTAAFGHKMLSRMGWQPGSGLGARLDGCTSHLHVAVKSDTLGLGAERTQDSGVGQKRWLETAQSYQEVLDRLSQGQEAKEEGKKSKSSKKDKRTKDKKSSKKSSRKENKKEAKKESKKDQRNQQTDSTGSEAAEEPTSQHASATVSHSEPQRNPRAHRAKFIRNKTVATYSSAHLQEILGFGLQQ